MSHEVAKPQNNNFKAFSGVIALIALIAGVYAMVEPMSQRIDFLERQLEETRRAMNVDDQRENINRNTLAAFQERFREIETQFDGERALSQRDEAILNDLNAWARKHDRIIERRDAEQWERIKAIERIVYDSVD